MGKIPIEIKKKTNKFIGKYPKISIVKDWINSEKSDVALTTFRNSISSDEPDVVVENLTKILDPAFGQLHLGQWDKDAKIIFSVQMNFVSKVNTFKMSGEKKFNESSIVLTDLVFFSNGKETDLRIDISANISVHTISQLIQRKGTNLKTIDNDVLQILQNARHLQTLFEDSIERKASNFERDKNYGILMPHRNGGLFLETLRIDTTLGFLLQKKPVFSARTYYTKPMLESRKYEVERMPGFCVNRELKIPPEHYNHMLSWFRGNIREI